MADSTFHLYQLQKLDSGITNLLQQISVIKSKINNRAYFQSVVTEMDQATNNLKEEQLESNAIEDKLSAKRIKLAQSESSLYSGKIQNPKELQNLQIEISSLKKAISILEDSQIERWEKIEILTSIMTEKLNKFEKAKDEEILAIQSFQAEISQLENEQQRLLLEKKGVTSQISPSFLAIYEKLVISKKGIAVSEIMDECCGSCGSTLTPSDCQHAKNHSIIQLCSNCGRILYAG